MSRHTWKAAEQEAADSGRDVIGLYVLASEAGGSESLPAGQELAEALQNAIYPLDERWTANTKKATARIRKDNEFILEAYSADAVRMVSAGTADLFGATPATKAARRLAEFVRDTRDLRILRTRLHRSPAPAVLSYGKLLALLAKLRSNVSFEFASPAGERSVAELSSGQLRAACSYIEETEVSSIFIQVRGSLAEWNPARRTFRLEGDDGRHYAGRWGSDIRRRYGGGEASLPALPVVAEALVERRTVYRESIDEESTVDILTELDTDPGLNREETLRAFRKLRARLQSALERDGGDEHASPISPADYTELADLANRLLDSNPLKGARLALNPADLADVHGLLAESRPIGRLVLSDGSDEFDMDGDHAESFGRSAEAREARRKAAIERQKLAAAAFADIVRLAGRLSNMIDALRDEPEAGPNEEALAESDGLNGRNSLRRV